MECSRPLLILYMFLFYKVKGGSAIAESGWNLCNIIHTVHSLFSCGLHSISCLTFDPNPTSQFSPGCHSTAIP